MTRKILIVSALYSLLLFAGCGTPKSQPHTEPIGGSPANIQQDNHTSTDTPNHQLPQELENNTKEDNTMAETHPINPSDFEPVITGRVSHDLKEAEGKNITRVEYRYAAKNGDFLSVIASTSGGQYFSDVKVIERKPNGEEKIYNKSNSSPDYRHMIELLYHIHTYQKNVGIITWINHPERPNWKDDDSTTWLIVDYGDIQYIVSSRQELPQDRYDAFNRIYTFITSHVRNFDRKMHQDIGEPAPAIIKEIHGKEYRLVPGTGNSVLQGAEIEWGDKKWWLEEEFNDTFVTTPESLKLTEGSFNHEPITSASITIDDDGDFKLRINQHELIGSLDNERLYQVMATAYFTELNESNKDKFAQNKHITNGRRVFFDYHNVDFDIDFDSFKSDEELQKYLHDNRKKLMYKRIVLHYHGEPYVHGHAVPPFRIYLDRK